MVGSIQVSTEVVPLRFRFRLLETACARWLVPELRCIAFPFAERRNRFLVPLWVLILVLPLAFVIRPARLCLGIFPYYGVKIAEDSLEPRRCEVLMGESRRDLEYPLCPNARQHPSAEPPAWDILPITLSSTLLPSQYLPVLPVRSRKRRLEQQR